MSTKAGQEAWRLLAELMFNGEMHDRFQGASHAIGVTPGLLKGLLHLEPDVGVPMRDLADAFSCDASYVTGLVDGLEERGWARREPFPGDRRIKAVVLTRAGVKAKERALAVLHSPPAALDALTAAEQRQLRDLMTKMAGADRDLQARARPA